MIEHKPWLYCEGTDECRELAGNEAGFKQLHEAVGKLLAENRRTLHFPNPSIGFSHLELLQHPPVSPPQSPRDKLTSLLIGLVLLSILLFALIGVHRTIDLLFS